MTALLSAGALRAALVHLLLSLFLQAQNLWWMKPAAPGMLLRQAGAVLVFQAPSVLAALLVGAFVAALARIGALRSGLLVSLAAGILAIADAWAFRVLGEHLGATHLSFIDSTAFLASSLLAEFDFLVPLDVLLLALGVLWQAHAPAGKLFAIRPPALLLGAVPAYLSLSAAAFLFAVPPEISWHPLAGLVRHPATVRAPQLAGVDLESVVTPPFGAQPVDGAEAAQLAGAAAAMARIERPNIVLVVLESTGARQLMRNGEIDATVTPNLARLARNGVLFDQVYANIPGTLQANLAMSTGGRYPTWEGLTDLMQYRYSGELLARSLRQSGYRTALFASADLAYLESRRFYAQAGYDLLSDFGQLNAERQHALRLNSWGGRDDATADSAAQWLDQAPDQGRGGEQPFFLHFMTNAPHHPYQIPSDFPPLLPGEDDRSRYLNALHHADAALGILMRKIASSGQAGRTVFLVTGDHGEAYDPLPGRSQGHRRGIYEDAVRSFLLVSFPAIPGALRSSRIGNHGDLLPTLLALAGSPLPAVPGQNLLGERFTQRTAFFHYGDASGSWGLRDGRWKYISPRAGAPAELYDLDSDPDERINLAEQEKEKVQRYEALCSAWFFGRNAEFRKFLTGFAAAPPSAERQQTRLGLEAQTTGVLVPDGNRVFFATAHSAHPGDRIALETRWGPTPNERHIVYRWQAPGGRQIERTHALHPLETHQRVLLPGMPPWPPGVWSVSMFVDGQKAGETRFEVTPEARAQAPANYRWPELVSLRVGLDSDRHALPVREIPVGVPIHFESEWNVSDQDRALTYALIAPSGKGEIEPFTVVAGQTRHSLKLTPPRDAEQGEWSVVVVYRDEEIARAQFRLGAPAWVR